MNTTTDYRDDKSERLVLRPSEVSRLLRLSRSSVYQALGTGEIPSIRIGRAILIPRARLEKILAEGQGGNDGKEGGV